MLGERCGKRPTGGSDSCSHLAPHDLSVGEAADLTADQVKGEGGDLLYAHKCDLVLKATSLALIKQLIEDLAAAQHDALKALLSGRTGAAVLGGGIHDQALEADSCDAGVVRQVVKLPDGRLGHGVTQQILRGEVDQRLPELAVHLASEQVEVVGRGGDVGDLHVDALDLFAKVAPGEPILVGLCHWGQDVGVLIHHLQVADGSQC
mmetsp:Transcript_27485/g.77749  ORF Transcript_27485/g.77749 Transcript_27485/m.77749 type:complete len:206 (+) Transcript_27485:169-786(+)